MKEALKAGYFGLTDEEGNYNEYSPLFTFYSKKFDKNYVVYTDEYLDDFGDMNILTSIYNPNDTELDFKPVESDEEWKMIDEAIMDFFDNYNRIGDEE